MPRTTSFEVADARNDATENTIGASSLLRVYDGTMPANARTALSGNNVLATGALPASGWSAPSASGVKAKAGVWAITGQPAAGAGTAGVFYRRYNAAGSICHEQGTFGAPVTLSTNALTAANSNVLNFASTTGVAIGRVVVGTGVPADTIVLAFTGTTVTLSKACPAGVANAASIAFGFDMNVNNNNIVDAQTITVDSYSKTDGNL